MSQELPDRFPFKLGRYRVVAPLGEGAQGSVYQAFLEGPLSFQLRVALKVVPLDGPEPDRLVKALANEARALAAVYHPNVVRIHDFAKVQAWYLLAVEYVEGVDLRGLLRSFTDQGVGVPPALTAEIARQVAAGLAAMHALTDAAGEPSPVVHRDLKPANVLLSRHGAVKLADFGLAKGKQIAFHTTRANVTRGTPPYMSPEQARGEPLTPASDRFSLGSLVYELLTGVPLFLGQSPTQTMIKVMKVEPTAELARADRICPELFGVLQRCLAPEPGMRFPTTARLAVALDEVCEQLGAADLPSAVARITAQPAGDPDPEVSAGSTRDFFFGEGEGDEPVTEMEFVADETVETEER